jgi:GntR family transcriptional regulator/MocR family aminotransferase
VKTWDFPVELDPAAATPLFLQIARAVAADVGRGRLHPGDALPGTRTLADALTVHRSTVVAAYAELCAQGWASTRPGGATMIATTSPDVAPRRFARTTAGLVGRAGFDVEPIGDRVRLMFPRDPKAIQMWGGMPDTRLVSSERLGTALRRVARRHGPKLLRYADDPRGWPPLRAAIAQMLATARGLAIGADDVLVTQGSQMAVDLVARTLVRPGDVVAVERLGYRPAWAALQRAGARLAPIAIDDEGLDVAALAKLPSLRAVYVTPHHQYPTTVVLSPRRRLALLELARARRFAIIEDDYDHEFHFEGRPILPLASADTTGQVVYIGGLAKIVAPGLRIGFCVAPAPLLARLTDERAITDRHGSTVIEAAVADLIDDGEIQRHARRARRIYQRRRDVLCAALHRRLGSALEFTVPPGGLALWTRIAPGIDVERWRERAAAAGVLVMTDRAFSLDPAKPTCMRIGYGACNERELELGVSRLAASRPRVG